MSQKINPEYVRNLALATVAGQAGCGTVIIIFAALFGGMFLDSRLHTHPVFTLGLILAAIPISLYSMIRLMLSAVGAIKMPPPKKSGVSDQGSSLTKENDS